MIHLTPQQWKILRAFRKAEKHTLSTTDLASLYITKYSGRIMELRRMGFQISPPRYQNGKYLYTLEDEPAWFGSVEGDDSAARDHTHATDDPATLPVPGASPSDAVVSLGAPRATSTQPVGDDSTPPIDGQVRRDTAAVVPQERRVPNPYEYELWGEAA